VSPRGVVIADLPGVEQHDTVTAGRRAAVAAAVGLHGAEGGATVAAVQVAVVTRFGPLLGAVAADGRVTTVLPGVAVTRPAVLPLAEARAAVAVIGVAVVTLLVQGDLRITADRDAERPRPRALISGGNRAPVAAVVRVGVAVVTRLGAGHEPVAADIEVLTCLPRILAEESGLLGGAVFVASVPGRGVAVVADLPGLEHTVSTGVDGLAGLAGGGTDVSGMLLAHAGAAVAGQRVAVVALLHTGCLVDLPVTAGVGKDEALGRRILGLTDLV